MQIKSSVALSLALILAGCSMTSDDYWPDLFAGKEKQKAAAPAEAEPAAKAPAATQSSAPVMAASEPAAQPASPQMSAMDTETGTRVGERVTQLRADLNRLNETVDRQQEAVSSARMSAVTTAQSYHAAVAAISARLQLGTTPGNPVLVSQWNSAQQDLDKISAEIGQMNALATEIAGGSSLAAYILSSARAAYGLSGAVDTDHVNLSRIEDETNRTAVLIDRMLAEIHDVVVRRTAYVANERDNLSVMAAAIKRGVLLGSPVTSRSFNSLAQTESSEVLGGGRKALVVIRFDQPDIKYQQPLYNAMKAALERRPGARFDLVAVSPTAGSAAKIALAQSEAKKYASQVLRALTDMGLPAARVSLAATSSDKVSNSEVHIFVK